MRRFCRFPTRTLVATVGLLLSGGCDDDSFPTRPLPEEPSPAAHVISCQAVLTDLTLECGGSQGEVASGLNLSVTLGGQGTYAQLTSSNVSYSSTTQIFQADVTVQNLIGQALGTTDGATVDPNGVRVFFHSGPTVTGGTGTVAVANPDGYETFTESNQPYFKYPEILAGAEHFGYTKGGTSHAHPWQWTVESTVTSFVFQVYVTAAVFWPNGWVDIAPRLTYMEPGQSRTLAATVRDVLGQELPPQTITWSSSAPAYASIDPNTGLVTANALGTAYITATGTGTQAAGRGAVYVQDNDGWTHATALLPGETQDHSLSSAADRDWFHLDLEGAGDIAVTVTSPPTAGLYIAIGLMAYDGTVKSVCGPTGATLVLAQYNVPSELRALVMGASGCQTNGNPVPPSLAVPAYSISLDAALIAGPSGDSDEPNDTKLDAKLLVPGRTETAAIWKLGDQDWYKLALDGASDVVIRFPAVAWGTGQAIAVVLFDQDSRVIRGSCYELPSTQGNFTYDERRITFTNAPKDSWIAVRGTTGCIDSVPSTAGMVLGWYQIELAQANLVGTGLDPSEPNNSVLQTTPLNLGTPPSSITAEHALPIASDFDFYAPTWTGVGDLTISVSVPQNTLGYLPDLPSQAVYLQVWDGNQVTIGRVCQSMRNPDGTTAPPAGLALTNAPQGMFFSVRAVTGCVDATTPSASSGYLGSYTLTVTVTPPSGPTIRQWVGGDPAGPSDWDNGNNWSPVGVPSAQDSVVIPAGAVTMPVLDANAEIGRIEVLPQATLSLAGYTMTVWEDVLSGGQLLGPGTVTIAGSGSTAAGSLPSVLVTGGADLVGPVTVSGVLTVRGGSLNEKGFPLVIRGAVP